MPEKESQIVILAGPKGAGKSTLAPELMRRFGIPDFVNADTIARGLSAYDPESVAIEAGRLMLNRLKELAAARRDFAFETTLSSRSYARWLEGLAKSGYRIDLHFVWVASPALSSGRVAARVRRGGHYVDPETVERRYRRGIPNFFTLYRRLATNWTVYDNSSGKTVVLAQGRGEEVGVIHYAQEWNEFLSRAD